MRRTPARIISTAAAVTLAAGFAFGQAFEPPGRSPVQPSSRPATGGAATRPASTQPATRPADPRSLSSDEMFGQMLRPPTVGQPRPLQPIVDAAGPDRTSGPGAVKPNAPSVMTLREGTFIIDRVGRLQKSPDGSPAQFVFEADGRSLREPPLLILPNTKLMMMENALTGATRDLRFRVSGMLTEFRGRNYVLMEKVTVEPESRQQF